MVKKTLKKLVSIVIVTHNRQKIVLDCLDSVHQTKYPNFEVILVDNGSGDNTISLVRKKYPQIKIIALKTNTGLNAGKNSGQKIAKGKYIFFLDSDTRLDKSCLGELVNLARSDAQIGLVCPKMYYQKPKNVIWYAGAYVNLWTSRTKNVGCNQIDKGQFDQVSDTQFAPTAYLATKKVVRKLKNHDQSLFMTYGDTDYGIRVKKLGFKVVFCPQSKLWHRLNQKDNLKTIRSLGYNAPLRAYYFSRNRIVFMKRHAPKLNFIVFFLFFFPLFTLYISYKIIAFGDFQFLKPHWQGSIDGFKFAFNNQLSSKWQ